MQNHPYQKFAALFFFCSLAACGYDTNQAQHVPVEIQSSDQWPAIALPDLSQQPIYLKVAYVDNSRFKRPTDKQLKKILLRSQQMVKQHFNISIEFSEISQLSIKNVFKRLEPKLIAQRSSEIVNINFIDKQSREVMQQAIFKTLSNYADNKKNVIDYAQPHLLQPEIKQKDFIGLSYALVDTLITRLQYWHKKQADDGKPVLDDLGHHEWVWWDSLGYTDLSYDILITNQLVASAEYFAMDVHSSIRGGLTAGTTTYNKNTVSNSYAYIMLYPMLNDSPLLTTLRQDVNYSEQQIINYSAALLTHELGHLLLHLGHPFGNKYCIMSPTVMLNYREWYDNLDASKCTVGSNSDMLPGAAIINYNRNW